MNNVTRRAGILVVLLVAATVSAAMSRGSTLTLDWHTIDAGGGTSGSASFELTGTAGQPDAGPVLASASFEVVGGFWMGGPIETCASDIAGNGGSGPDGLINLFDLLLLIDNWGTSGAGAAISDQGGGAAIVDLFDLLAMLDAWGSC